MIRSSTFGRPYGYASYGVAGGSTTVSPAWELAKFTFQKDPTEDGIYWVDADGWVYYVSWPEPRSVPFPINVVWSPLSKKEINAQQDQTKSAEILLALATDKRQITGFRDGNKAGAIAHAKTLAGKGTKSGGGKKSSGDASSSGTGLTTSAGGGRMTTSGGGGRMTTSGGGMGGSSTPFYKNPWVIGGTAVAVLGIVLAFALRGKGKTS